MQTRSPETDRIIYIVDYDIPRLPQSRIRAFYRQMAKLKARMALFGKMSTQSVVITSDRALAEQVFSLAVSYGKGNIYVGQPLSR